MAKYSFVLLVLMGCTTLTDAPFDGVSGVYAGGGKFIDGIRNEPLKNYSAAFVLIAHGNYANATLSLKELPDTILNTHYEVSLGPDSNAKKIRYWQGKAFNRDLYTDLNQAIAHSDLLDCAFSYDSNYRWINGYIRLVLGGVRGTCQVIGARREQ